MNFLRKQIKTKLLLCKLLFIAHGRVRGFCKVILQYKNKASQLYNGCGTAYRVCINTKLQVSVQINQILLHNKK